MHKEVYKIVAQSFMLMHSKLPNIEHLRVKFGFQNWEGVLNINMEV